MREWLYVELGEKFLSDYDGDTYEIKEAQTDIKCRRCQEIIEIYWPYARGTWHYSKYHVECAKGNF